MIIWQLWLFEERGWRRVIMLLQSQAVAFLRPPSSLPSFLFCCFSFFSAWQELQIGGRGNVNKTRSVWRRRRRRWRQSEEGPRMKQRSRSRRKTNNKREREREREKERERELRKSYRRRQQPSCCCFSVAKMHITLFQVFSQKFEVWEQDKMICTRTILRQFVSCLDACAWQHKTYET
jgi:hypothetical protein